MLRRAWSFLWGVWCTWLLACWTGSAWRRATDRVVVVGAGMAGATAAAELHAAGFHVSVVEARGRVGGRVYTNVDLGFPIELGAAFVHRPQYENPVLGLLDAHGVRHVEYDFAKGVYFDSDGGRYTDAERRWGKLMFDRIMYEDVMEAMEGAVEEEGPLWDESLWTTLNALESYHALPPRYRRLVDLFCFQYVVQELQADLDDVSAKEFDPIWAGTVTPHSTLPQYPYGTEYGARAAQHGVDLDTLPDEAEAAEVCSAGAGTLYPSPDRFVAGGYAGVVSGLLRGVSVALKTRVDAVRYRDHAAWILQLEEWLDDHALWGEPQFAAARHAVYSIAAVVEEAFLGGWAAGARAELTATDDGGAAAIPADRVILTLPIGVLKARRVIFDPPLPYALQDAIADLGVSAALKVAMCWQPEDVFWGDEQYHYFHAYPPGGDAAGTFGRGEFVEAVNLWTLRASPCLLFEVETAFAKALSARPLQDKVDSLLRAVRNIYPGAPPPTLGSVESDFASPYSDGGYVHFGVDTSAEHGEEFTYPVSRCLYWAGEHTVWEHYGNTHGAWLSGKRAAAQVMGSYHHTWLALATATVFTALTRPSKAA
eukprot:TRINITY_DN22388_c0_g1_i1.p1 TRINITY_DN22388_c0_g1~~TRINITY_DN22388_c0_g1_i1.p1  ORF type:complete len:596 (+),score=169.15 TRINITY_DN22388_c0_g1_i1:37-1824(+)